MQLVGAAIFGAVCSFIPTATYGQAFGSWAVERSGEYVEAYTSNSTGSVFGVLCSAQCLFYIDTKTTCEEKSEYPVLVNTSAGASYMKMVCMHVENSGRTRHVNILDDFETLKEMASSGSQIGFAVPLKDGAFKVSRFNLKGYSQAASVLARLQQGRPQGRPASFRDEVL